MTQMPGFKGYIHDVGGPTANFRNPACRKQMEHGVCPDRQCLYPKPCPNLDADESDYLDVLKSLRDLPGIKKVFIRSGVRYDYMLKDKSKAFFKALVRYHVSGQLRVAPEHVSATVLDKMGKPSFEVYKRFLNQFEQYDRSFKTNQYVVPYFITGHPGCTLDDAIQLSEYIRDHGAVPEQVQDFYPTPGSLATAMYYTGLDPRTMQPVYVPKGIEKRMQRALIQYNKPENYRLVHDALIQAGRQDLIGNSRKALIKENYGNTSAQSERRKISKKNNERKNGGKNGKNRKKTHRIN